MAVIHTDKKRLSLAIPILAATAVVAGIGIWWYQQASAPTSVTPIAPVASGPDTALTPSKTDTPHSSITDTPASPQEIEKLMEEQRQTAKAIEAQPQLKPIKGPVTERPSFMSDMEWSVFKSVAMQQPDPDKALTSLVNKVRFIKQLEVFQDLPASADKVKRQALASELLSDLPERLRNHDYDYAGAVQLQNQLLAAAEPDPSKRAGLASRQSKLLQQIETEMTAAAAAAASASTTK